ncbi:MAG: hypothetical protein GX804_06990 [Lentisphaerae bacterium]|nr:hypothetical protein [Lentisphaerota bacterium]
MMNRAINRRDRSGQAIVEFIVGLFGIILLAALVFFLGHVQLLDSDSLVRASADAISSSMGHGISSTFTPLADWDEGGDDKPYTKDDRAIHGNFYRLRSHITSSSAPGGDWSGTRRGDGSSVVYNEIVHVNDGVLSQSTFGFVSSRDSETVPVPPIIQNILGLPGEIVIRNEVWMPQTGGLY